MGFRIMGKMAARFSVGKQVSQLNSKNGRWFVEKNLLNLDEK